VSLQQKHQPTTLRYTQDDSPILRRVKIGSSSVPTRLGFPIFCFAPPGDDILLIILPTLSTGVVGGLGVPKMCCPRTPFRFSISLHSVISYLRYYILILPYFLWSHIGSISMLIIHFQIYMSSWPPSRPPTQCLINAPARYRTRLGARRPCCTLINAHATPIE
jgi:hypothetical protein